MRACVRACVCVCVRVCACVFACARVFVDISQYMRFNLRINMLNYKLIYIYINIPIT